MNSTPDGTREHRHIDWEDLKLIPRLVSIDLPKENKRVGNALFLHNGAGQAILWHVFIKPEYRRRKLAATIMEAAKLMFNEIATDWESDGGEKLCEYTGFKKRKTDELRFVWKKEKPIIKLLNKGLIV